MGLTMRFAILLFGAAWAQDALKFGLTGMLGGLDPTDGSAPWKIISHGIAEKLFTVNKAGEVVPQIAVDCVKVSDGWEVNLKATYKFSDGTPVTAADVVTCLTAQNTQNSAASASCGTMTFTAPTTTKVKITSTVETHIMESVLAEWAFPIYKVQAAAVGGHIFTGPYKASVFEKDVKLQLVPNEYHFDGKYKQRLNIDVIPYASGDLLAAAAKDGSVDFAHHLPVGKLAELRAVTGLTVASMEVGYHYFMIYNTNSSAGKVCSDLKVRQAIDLALDRAAIAQDALKGAKPTRSFFPDYTPWYKEAGSTAADTTAAGTKLTEAGWTCAGTCGAAGADGKRTKAGVALTVDLVNYPFRPGLGLMAPTIKTQLEAIGITVNSITTDGGAWPGSLPCYDHTDGTKKCMKDGHYDLLLWAQHTLPAGDPSWFFNEFAKSTGGRNHAHLDSSNIDAKVAAMVGATTHAARVTASGEVQVAMQAEMPYSNLVTPEWHVAMSSKLVGLGYEVWGSDYYVIHADLLNTTTTESSAMSMPLAMALFAALLF